MASSFSSCNTVFSSVRICSCNDSTTSLPVTVASADGLEARSSSIMLRLSLSSSTCSASSFLHSLSSVRRDSACAAISSRSASGTMGSDSWRSVSSSDASLRLSSSSLLLASRNSLICSRKAVSSDSSVTAESDGLLDATRFNRSEGLPFAERCGPYIDTNPLPPSLAAAVDEAVAVGPTDRRSEDRRRTVASVAVPRRLGDALGTLMPSGLRSGCAGAMFSLSTAPVFFLLESGAAVSAEAAVALVAPRVRVDCIFCCRNFKESVVVSIKTNKDSLCALLSLCLFKGWLWRCWPTRASP
ncbi:hypothetical protein GQ42DRAFT_83631 [Ramicandelaber brevisporus]|nr:hypothetical protein GQ42DRAFT_83631 [Ramicandelaber brevisporus]